MTDYNILLLLAAMTKLPNLTMSIDNTKAVLDRIAPRMPDDVKDFFLQAFGDKLARMGKALDSSVRSKPRNSVLLQGQGEEAYPTESRMKHKAKHAAEKELTGEKH